MKNSNDIIGNRTRDLPACSAVPQPTAPPRAPAVFLTHVQYSADYNVLDLTATKSMHFHARNHNFKTSFNMASGTTCLSDDSLNTFRPERTRELLIIMKSN